MPNDRLAIVYCGAAVLAMVRWCGAAPAAASSTSLHGTRVRLECPAEHMHLVGFPIEKRKRLASIGKARPSSPVGFRRASKRSSAEGQMRGNAPFSVVGVDKSRKVRENLDMYNSVVLRHDESRKNRCAS